MTTKKQPDTKARTNEEELGGELFRFVNVGDTISGTIVASDEIEIDEKSVSRLTLSHDDNSQSVILLTENLRQKLLGLPAGTAIRIVYEGEIPIKGGRRFRNFKVFKVNS